jgi:hypothetical protein
MTYKKLLKKTYSIIVINIVVFLFLAKQEGLLISDLPKGIIRPQNVIFFLHIVLKSHKEIVS